ncbi:MAG: winged helix-turn-helix domain-containing protein [Afipia sp.]|nr:winged helix-turn-helix domain-containing protein [Afipia sp.]
MASDLTSSVQRQIRRGNYQVFPDLRLLLRNGEKVDLSGKPFEIALMLIEANNAAVAKDDLLRSIWPNQIVEENNLQAHISIIRRALGPDRGLLKTEFGNGYRLELPGENAGDSPTPHASSQFQVPLTTTPLFGRLEELAVMDRMIAAGNLVTITGIGGIGKTRLATELAHRSRRNFGDSIFFVELSSLTSAALVLPTIAARVNADLTATGSSERSTGPVEQSARTLLILDGCEHLLNSVVEAVQLLLRCAPALTIVTTSQEPLHIDGEQVLRLQPLDIPTDDVTSLERASEFASAQLLISRIRSIDHDFPVDDTSTQEICRICRQLDGIPLALELAGSRVPLIGLHEVVKGLSDRFRLLTAGRRTAMPRHQTLRATLEWSYELLSTSEQRLLNRLGIFAGPFTLASAATVSNTINDPGPSAVDMISSLVAKSLVCRDTNSRQRFYLFESMRAFTLEKLVATGELPHIAHRHSQFFSDRLSSASADWQDMPLDKWLAEYKDDLSDVRAALDASITEVEDAAISAEQICDSLPFWMQLSLLDECRVRVSNILEKLSSTGKIDASLEMRLQRALGAALAWAQGPTPQVAASWKRTLILSQRNNDAEHQMQGHYGLWLYNLRSGSYQTAAQHADKLASMGRASSDMVAKWTGERAKGVTLHFLGDNIGAKQLIESVLTGHDYSRSRSFPLRFGVDQRIAGFAFLARTLWLLGDAHGAEDAAEAAIAEAAELDHVSSLCCALLEGGCALWAISGQWKKLAEASETAVKIADRYNLGFWRSYAEGFIALSRSNTSPDNSSLRSLQAAAGSLSRIGVHPGYSLFTIGIARLQANLGDHQGAEKTTDGLIKSIGSEQHWAMPEILRLKVSFAKH